MGTKKDKPVLTPLHQEATQHGVTLCKIASVSLPLDPLDGRMQDAWEWYQVLDKFFKENGIRHGLVEVQISGYDSSLDGVTVTASVGKTDAELEIEIGQKKEQEASRATFGRKIARDNAKKRKEYELKEYERLKKKFGGPK